MASEVATGLLALGGALVGSAASYLFGARAAARQTEVEDRRRWLQDRRPLYARYLGSCVSAEQDLYALGHKIPDSLEWHRGHGLTVDWAGYEDRQTTAYRSMRDLVDADIPSLLAEVELMAGPEVRKHARIALASLGSYLHLIDPLHLESAVGMHALVAPDIDAMRDAIRTELGTTATVSEQRKWTRRWFTRS